MQPAALLVAAAAGLGLLKYRLAGDQLSFQRTTQLIFKDRVGLVFLVVCRDR